ncbi:MAG: transcription-repair coupling factor [Verrucomicrobiota bacterium]
MVKEVIQKIRQTPAVQKLVRRVERGGALSCAGVSRAAQPFVAAALKAIFPERTIVVVTDGVKSQESFQQDLTTWLNGKLSQVPSLTVTQEKVESTLVSAFAPASAASSQAAAAPPHDGRSSHKTPHAANAAVGSQTPLFYPAWEVLPHEPKLPHADVISERLETLVALSAARDGHGNRSSSGSRGLLINTTVTALLQRTFAPGEIARRTRRLQRGDRIDPLDLIEWLEDQGYEPEAQVTQKGEIALRGGIVDVFPLTSPWPVRLEFFGDELESLRLFDPLTQVSREAIEAVTLPPAGELGLLKREMASHPSEVKATLLDHLSENTLFVLCEPDALEEHARVYAEQIPGHDPFFIDWEEFQTHLDRSRATVLALEESEIPAAETANADSELIVETIHERSETELASESERGDCLLPIPNLDPYRPLAERLPDPQIAETQRREFFAQLHRWLRQGYAVHVFCNNEGERDRFVEIWDEYGFGNVNTPAPSARYDEAGGEARSAVEDDKTSPAPKPVLHLGALVRGFLFEPAKMVVVTDAEIFGRYKVQRPRRLKSPHAAAARSALDIDFTNLEEGDFVVHLQHGIGRYLGLQLVPAGAGRKKLAHESENAGGQECLVIEYAPSAPDQPPPKLYVPVTEAHLVSKYVGTGKARPALNTLGGTRWARAKAQAERAVRDLASELLAIQAARESQPGHAFPADSTWQREFEASFLYEETPDQMRAITETKRDLELPRPMDRLICGDVGYGKTEVAIRAAFKAVMGGKQVAVLVPTTILAQQHFNTFRERMADYPVRVEQLSRFRTRREQQRIVRQLAEGSIDIVIGTHRLIQEDVAFKDLGLVIIDEEQRFGVLHKEKFKLLRKLVDVLTLSATPIPRTLYLALTGARDMSTIETPPQDRLPVETIVTQFDERIIRDAIQRELNREGQVYYLHNRITDIDNVALRIRALVPKARVIVGHGQMHSDELEEVMARFINGEADVLVSTTIIESGIDIPNANTIIIDRADRFGLSDLYQLRGRVGRYKHQAYAYLLLPRHAALLSDVRKRISAIKQYSSLGSGFKIAMRDLEIRGAGNLLGAEQSGHITAVGFDLYCQLLKQSVSALKGEKVMPRVEVQVRFDFLALNPEENVFASEGEEPAPRFETDLDEISVPREVASYLTHPSRGGRKPAPPRTEAKAVPLRRVPAYIPLNYIPLPQQRVEIYRKLAQATDKAALEKLREELRDRFGKLPASVELLLQVAALKILAAERGVTAIETREDKLMLTRANDYLMIGGKFPRLTKKDAKGRLNEIRRLLLSL